MEENKFWNDENVKEFCEYVGLRVGKNTVIREQIKHLQHDFKKLEASKQPPIPLDYEVIEYGYTQNNVTDVDLEYISKVKRKSDGEVFTCHETKVVDPNTKHECVISEIYIGRENRIYFNGVELNHVQKVKEPIPEETFGVKLTIVDFMKLKKFIDTLR